MKNLATFCILIFLGIIFAWPLASQNIPAITLGPKLGINSSILYTDLNDYKEDETLGFKGGLFFRLANRSRIYLQPEAYFDFKGGSFSYTINETDPYTPSINTKDNAQLTIKIKTIDVPLLLGLKVLDLQGFNFRLMAGPVASYVLEESASLDVDGEDWSNRLPDDLIQDAIWSFQAGGGMDILMFTLDFRYEFGINNISSIQTAVARTYLYNLSVGLKLF